MAGGQEGRYGTVPAQKVQERPFAFRGEWYYCFIDKRNIHRGTGGDVMSKVDIGRARSLSIKCLSEVSWHDNDRMRQGIRQGGAPRKVLDGRGVGPRFAYSRSLTS